MHFIKVLKSTNLNKRLKFCIVLLKQDLVLELQRHVLAPRRAVQLRQVVVRRDRVRVRLAEALAVTSVRNAVQQVTAATGVSRRQVYARALRLTKPAADDE